MGARYTREYEVEYLQKLKLLIGDDKRIEVHDVTDNVDQYFQVTDCLLFTSTNEVTPMVIPEAMSYGIPIVSSNIGGISEMFTDGVEGFMFDVHDELKAIHSCSLLLNDESKRSAMGKAGLIRYNSFFKMDIMVSKYRQLIMETAPPVILLDLDGTLVDWDKGFKEKWGQRSEISRNASYHMEHCVPPENFQDAMDIILSPNFFAQLPLMKGALQALNEMERYGFKLKICTAPLYASDYCCQDKVKWVKKNLGESWLSRLVMCSDKKLIKADYLIDDKLFEDSAGDEHSCWKQIVYDQPYNRNSILPRLYRWKDWKKGNNHTVIIIVIIYHSLYYYLVLLAQMLLSDEMCPFPSMNASSPTALVIPIPSREVQKRQDLLIGVDSDPLTPDELSSFAGSLSFIKSGDTPSSSPKHIKLGKHFSLLLIIPILIFTIIQIEKKTALEENKKSRKKIIAKELDRKSVFDFFESNGEEQKY